MFFVKYFSHLCDTAAHFGALGHPVEIRRESDGAFVSSMHETDGNTLILSRCPKVEGIDGSACLANLGYLTKILSTIGDEIGPTDVDVETDNERGMLRRLVLRGARITASYQARVLEEGTSEKTRWRLGDGQVTRLTAKFQPAHYEMFKKAIGIATAFDKKEDTLASFVEDAGSINVVFRKDFPDATAARLFDDFDGQLPKGAVYKSDRVLPMLSFASAGEESEARFNEKTFVVTTKKAGIDYTIATSRYAGSTG